MRCLWETGTQSSWHPSRDRASYNLVPRKTPESRPPPICRRCAGWEWSDPVPNSQTLHRPAATGAPAVGIAAIRRTPVAGPRYRSHVLGGKGSRLRNAGRRHPLLRSIAAGCRVSRCSNRRTARPITHIRSPWTMISPCSSSDSMSKMSFAACPRLRFRRASSGGIQKVSGCAWCDASPDRSSQESLSMSGKRMDSSNARYNVVRLWPACVPENQRRGAGTTSMLQVCAEPTPFILPARHRSRLAGRKCMPACSSTNYIPEPPFYPIQRSVCQHWHRTAI